MTSVHEDRTHAGFHLLAGMLRSPEPNEWVSSTLEVSTSRVAALEVLAYLFLMSMDGDDDGPTGPNHSLRLHLDIALASLNHDMPRLLSAAGKAGAFADSMGWHAIGDTPAALIGESMAIAADMADIITLYREARERWIAEREGMTNAEG